MSANQPPWVECPSATINLAVPAETRFSELDASLVAKSRILLGEIIGQMPLELEIMGELAGQHADSSRFHPEFHALAQLVDADWRQVAIANLSYDLMLMQIGCTTLAIPTPQGPVVARNMDWFPEAALAQASCLVHYRHGENAVFTNAGWPGFTGVVTGQSANGFAVILNAVFGSEPPCQTGHPVLLLIRRVLEDARDFDEALKLLRDTQIIAPALFTLVGTKNDQRVVIERSPRRHALRWAEPGEVLIATNDYRKLEKPAHHLGGLEIYATTCTRYDFLRNHFDNRAANPSPEDEELLYVLSDPNVAQCITAQHIVLRPRQGTVRLYAPRHLV